MTQHDVDADEILATNHYLVLSTADSMGTPWASPVYFAHTGRYRFVWVSSPDAVHSRNLRHRADAAIVVFNSQVAIGQARAFYARVTAEHVPDSELADELAVFNRRSVADGAGSWDRDTVTGSARLRLYRAVAAEAWVMIADDGPDRRIPVAVD